MEDPPLPLGSSVFAREITQIKKTIGTALTTNDFTDKSLPEYIRMGPTMASA